MVCFVSEMDQFFVHVGTSGGIQNASDDNFADFAGRMAADYGDGALESHGVEVRGCQDRMKMSIVCQQAEAFNLYYCLRIDSMRMV